VAVRGPRAPNIGLDAVAGRPLEECGIDLLRFDDMLPGCYDPVARLADMDLDGVWGAMCFPSFAKLACPVFIGVDNITWGSDYPHSDSNWPHSRKVAEEAFRDVPDSEVQQIAELNARRLYNFPDPEPTTTH
jgi:hypothetical protein